MLDAITSPEWAYRYYSFNILEGQPSTYKEFAEGYYEREVDLSAVEHIYQHKALTPEIVAALNADVSLGDLKADMEEIGYPNGAI